MPSQRLSRQSRGRLCGPRPSAPTHACGTRNHRQQSTAPAGPRLGRPTGLVGPKRLRVRGRPGRRAAGAEIKRKAAQAELHSQLSNSHFQRHPCLVQLGRAYKKSCGACPLRTALASDVLALASCTRGNCAVAVGRTLRCRCRRTQR